MIHPPKGGHLSTEHEASDGITPVLVLGGEQFEAGALIKAGSHRTAAE